MNLTITQDNTRTETINSSIIDKLYEIAFAASSDPNSTVSLTGRLESPKGYKFKIDWLNTNFSPDLTITVPSSGQYIAFVDSAVENILKTSIGDGNGVGILSIHDLQDLNSLGFVNNTDITDFREGVLFDNASIATSAGFVNGCTNLDVVGIPPYLRQWGSLITYGCAPHKIVISNWNNWIDPGIVRNGLLLCDIKHDLCTLNADKTLSVVTSINLPEGVNFPSGHLTFGGFYNSTINSVNIPTTVTRLNSFLGSDILTITFTQGSTLSSIEQYCFYDCNKLELDLANLPLTITTIGLNAFRNCTALSGALSLPNCTSIENYAFADTKITSITDLSSITSFGNNGSFGSLTSLTTISLSVWARILDRYAITSGGDYLFNNCRSLDLDLSTLPKSATSFRYRMFSGNMPLVRGDINLPNLLVWGQPFNYGYTFGTISISNMGVITELYEDWIRAIAPKFIVLPSTLLRMNGRNVIVSQYIQCLATTPPTFILNNLSTSKPIFVPDGSLSAYLAATGWSSLDLRSMNDFAAQASANNWDLPTTNS